MSKRSEVLARAEQILKQVPFSKQNEGMVNSLLRLADAMEVDEKAATRGNGTIVAEKEVSTKSQREEMEFRGYVERPSETRTYAYLQNGTTPGSFLVPSQWKSEYQKRLVSSSGWLRAGATVDNTNTGRKYLSFFSDDSANVADIIGEGVTFNDYNPVYTQPSPDLKRFATATILSSELWQDSAFDISSHLQSLFAVRVARKFNSFASNDGTYGLLAQLNAPATAASSSVPTLAELAAMQDPSVIDPAYLEADSQPVYMMSPAMRTTLMKQIDTAGRRIYPEIADGKLLGLPLVVNVDMVATAGSVAVVAGSVKRAILVQDVSPLLVVSTERYAELSSVFYAFSHRLGVKLADANAVTALKLHA